MARLHIILGIFAVIGIQTPICRAEILSNVCDVARLHDRDALVGRPFRLLTQIQVPANKRHGIMTVGTMEGAALLYDDRAERDIAFRAGDHVVAEGRLFCSIPGYVFASCTNLTFLSHDQPAPVSPVSAADLLGGVYDCRVVTIRGFVRDTMADEIDAEFCSLILQEGNDFIYAAVRLNGNAAVDVEKYVGAEVEITGTCSPYPHPFRRQARRPVVVADLGDVRIVTPPAADPFIVPELRDLDYPESRDTLLLGRQATRGFVSAAWSDGNFLIRTDDGRNIRVETADGSTPPYGTCAEATGFVDINPYTVGLIRAIWRPFTDATVRQDLQTADVTIADLTTDHKGRHALQPRYHGKPIRLRGTVISLPDGGNVSCLMYACCDGETIPVDLNVHRHVADKLAVGALIEFSGTCVMRTGSWRPGTVFPKIRDFTVVLRTPSDIRILARPPWWTPARLKLAILVLFAALAGAILLTVLFQRSAERRGRKLAKEKIAHALADMKVDERTRLAVELHDSITQSLTGASMEIRTALRLADTDTAEMKNQLSIALGTIDSSRGELRNCIWDLRNQALDASTVNDAIRQVLAPHVSVADLHVDFDVPRGLFSDPTLHTILCIIRELAVNAVRHGRATAVAISARLEDGRLDFSVKDNGTGFDPDDCPGVEQGHFGLQGIRERLKKLGGTRSISSKTGHGTSASMTIDQTSVKRT